MRTQVHSSAVTPFLLVVIVCLVSLCAAIPDGTALQSEDVKSRSSPVADPEPRHGHLSLGAVSERRLPYNFVSGVIDPLTKTIDTALEPLTSSLPIRLLIGGSVKVAIDYFLNLVLVPLQGLAASALPIVKTIRAIVCLVNLVAYFIDGGEGSFGKTVDMILGYVDFAVYEIGEIAKRQPA